MACRHNPESGRLSIVGDARRSGRAFGQIECRETRDTGGQSRERWTPKYQIPGERPLRMDSDDSQARLRHPMAHRAGPMQQQYHA